MSPRIKWSICLLLFGATFLNYLDRQTLSVSASHLAEELQLTDGDLGRLFFGFLFAYGIAQLFVGPLLDRFRTVPAYAAAVVLWSLMGASSGLASGFVGLMATRMLLGIFEAPNWPLALRTTARIFPPQQRSLAIGIFQSGTSLGALIAPPVIIWLTQHWGWRTAFIACGALGVLWTALWLITVRGPAAKLLDQAGLPNQPATPGKVEAHAHGPTTFNAMLRSPAFWGLLVATGFVNPLQYLYTSWLPRYFTTYAGVEFGKELAARLVVVYLALDLGLWLGGGGVAWLSGRLSVVRARLIVTGIGTVGMSVIPFVALAHDLDVITALICVAMFGLGCFLVNYLSFVSEISRERVAMAAGLLGGVGSLTGAGFMLLVGNIVQSTHSFNATFFVAGLMPMIAFAGLFYSARSKARALNDA